MKNIFLLTLTLLFACQSTKKEEVDLKALKDEVFVLHDEVMPMMGDLRKVRKSLMAQVDSIQAIDPTKAEEFTLTSTDLDAANESMMMWMRNFDPNFEGTDEETLKYLTDQKTSIGEVNTRMKETLKKGQALLEN